MWFGSVTFVFPVLYKYTETVLQRNPDRGMWSVRFSAQQFHITWLPHVCWSEVRFLWIPTESSLSCTVWDDVKTLEDAAWQISPRAAGLLIKTVFAGRKKVNCRHYKINSTGQLSGWAGGGEEHFITGSFTLVTVSVHFHFTQSLDSLAISFTPSHPLKEKLHFLGDLTPRSP